MSYVARSKEYEVTHCAAPAKKKEIYLDKFLEKLGDIKKEPEHWMMIARQCRCVAVKTNNGCRRSQGHRRWLLRHQVRQCQCHQQGATTIEVGDTKDPLCFAEIRAIVGRSVSHLFGQIGWRQQVCLICAVVNLAMSLSGETGPAYIDPLVLRC